MALTSAGNALRTRRGNTLGNISGGILLVEGGGGAKRMLRTGGGIASGVPPGRLAGVTCLFETGPSVVCSAVGGKEIILRAE